MFQKLMARQEIRFLFVGILNTIVGYGIYAFLVFFHMHYLVANTISTILGVLHSYLWNRYFTFRSKEKAGTELIKFISVYLLSYVIGTCTLYLFNHYLHISPYLAGLINLVITTLISYFGHKNFSFKKIKINFQELKKYKKYIIPVILCCASFLVLLLFQNVSEFTDEGDVMLGALTLAKGGYIYSDFASQHLPFTYLFFSLFAFLGVHSILGFRICLYLTLSLFFTFLYVRYHKKIGSLPFLLYPFVYMFFMSYTLGSRVLSEHIESQCLVLLILELIVFWKEKKLSVSSKIIIPTAIVVSILSAFVSIIPCFVIVLTFIGLDISFEPHFHFTKYLQHFWKEYKLIIIVGLGLVGLFLGYLLVTGTLEECYKQAFYLNTEIYSKYSGYSSNPLKTMINIPFQFLQSFQLKLTKDNIIFIALAFILFLYGYEMSKKSIGFSLITVYIILLCGNRTFFEFHALPLYAALSICALYVIQNWPKEIIVCGTFVFVIAFAMVNKTNLMNYLKPRSVDTTYYNEVNQLNNSDYLFRVDVSTSAFLDAEKMPGSRFSGLVPWFAEIYEDEYLNDIKEKNPNIIYYEPCSEVWGHYYKDFVPKIRNYIFQNYTYNSHYHLWIRKDYLKDSEHLLQNDFAEYSNAYRYNYPYPIQNNYLEQTIYPEANLRKINIFLGTYHRTNYSHLLFEILDDDALVYQNEFSADHLIDNSWYEINYPFLKGKKYTIRITSKYTNFSDFVAVYIAPDDFHLDSNQLYINGENSNSDLLMEMFYEGV